MTQRTAKGLDSVIERHHILPSEILWIYVDEEDGEKDGVQLLRSSSSLRAPVCRSCRSPCFLVLYVFHLYGPNTQLSR